MRRIFPVIKYASLAARMHHPGTGVVACSAAAWADAAL
jgi:hypothetical protein